MDAKLQLRAPLAPSYQKWLAEVIKFAEAGNVGAGRVLMRVVVRHLRDREPVPGLVADWFGARLEAAVAAPHQSGQALRIALRRGHHADDLLAAMRAETVREFAAWEAFELIQSGKGVYRITRDAGGKPCAFDIIKTRLAKIDQNVKADTIRRWYDERLRRMRREDEQEKLEERPPKTFQISRPL